MTRINELKNEINHLKGQLYIKQDELVREVTKYNKRKPDIIKSLKEKYLHKIFKNGYSIKQQDYKTYNYRYIKDIKDVDGVICITSNKILVDDDNNYTFVKDHIQEVYDDELFTSDISTIQEWNEMLKTTMDVFYIE